MPRPRLHTAGSFELVPALAVVQRVVREHGRDGARAVARALKADRTFSVLLGLSSTAFVALAAREAARLRARRAAERKAEKGGSGAKAGPAVVMHHGADGGKKKKRRYKVDASFVKQFTFLMRIAFGGKGKRSSPCPRSQRSLPSNTNTRAHTHTRTHLSPPARSHRPSPCARVRTQCARPCGGG